MPTLKISDDSGFLGLANFHQYRSFIAPDWDFHTLKSRILEEMNAHHLLFWATGLENKWTVTITDQPPDKEAFREARAVIEVTDGKLYLTNYESLSMAAQFEKVRLPESHYQDAYIELNNGKYMAKIRQMFNPDAFDVKAAGPHFELVLMKIKKNKDLYKNNLKEIFWSED